MGTYCTKNTQSKSIIKSAPTLVPTLAASNISSVTILDQITKYYKFIKVLGHGNFGVVRKAEHKSVDDSKIYAIKSINKEKVVGTEKLLKRELSILRELEHPNILKMYEIYEDIKYIHIVTEI